MKKISLDIISPERLLLQDEVNFVVLPALQGPCGILPGHTHFLTQLTIGELKMVKDNETYFFAVGGGFAEVHPHKVSVFAETAEMAQEIDAERARLAQGKAKEELSKATTPQDLASAQAALRRALLRLHIAELRGVKRHRVPPGPS